MAKRGGVSEVNGFVSVKNEDNKANSKKVVSISGGKSQPKTSPSSKQTSKTVPSDAQKVKKTDGTKTKTAVPSKSKAVAENGQKKPTVSKPPGVVAKASGVVAKSPGVVSKAPGVVSKAPGVAGTSKTTATSPRDKKSARDSSTAPSKTKTSNTSTKAAPPARRATETNAKAEVKTRTGTPFIKTNDVRNSTVERRSQQTKSSVNSSAVKTSKIDPTKSRSVSSSKNVAEVKSAKNDSKDVKGSLVKRSATKPNIDPPPSSDKRSTSSSKSKRDLTTIKISSKEKSIITIQDPPTSKETEKININSKYLETVYFEVDMGSGKTPQKKSAKVEETTLKSEEAAPSPPPLSRQGTFTKDEDESKENSLTLPVIDKSEAEEYDYEDDFEDYESDFEEYETESGVSSDSESQQLNKNTSSTPSPSEARKTSSKPIGKTVEEEKKLDSGSYDLTAKSGGYTLPQSIKQKQLDQIKEAITRENSAYSEKVKATPEPPNEQKVQHILNFVDALKRQENESAKKEIKNRSTFILEKIKLHEQSIAIFEEDFFFSNDSDPYRGLNVAHAMCEAEVVLRNEDVQTDDIRMVEKWTQFPTAFHNFRGSNKTLEAYIEDYRGFGGDNVEVDLSSWVNPYYNTQKMYNFIESAGQVMLIMLEEAERWKSDGNVSVMKAKQEHGFSRGYIPIQTKNIQFLKNRPICDIVFSPHNENIFVSSHRFLKNIENLPTFEEQFLARSVLCLWSMLEPSQPLAIFVASCQISAICFDAFHTNLLYGGLIDGSVCLWDTNERSIFHKETTAGSVDYLLRTPSYCSSYLLIEDLHCNVIAAIQSLGHDFSEKRSSENFIPTEVVTLDGEGKIILWVTVLTPSNVENDIVVEREDFGQTFWSKYKLVASRTLHPANNLPAYQNTWSLQFLCMSLAPSRGVLVGTNTGSIIHSMLSDEKPPVPIFNHKEETDSATSILSIERSPHQLPVFLAGCSNGTVRIHLMERKRPLQILIMENQLQGSPVTKIRWSLLGAGLFFVLDKNLNLHIWNLSKAESAPLLSLALKKFKASQFDISSDNKYLYIVFVVHKERLEVHRLKEQFVPEGRKDNLKDKQTFMKFVDKCCY